MGAALFLFACGVQGPPVPPRVERPEAVKDLAVSQIGGTLLLTFSLPQLATDGERLSKPLEVRISRAIYPAGQSVAAGPPENLWTALQPEDVQRYLRNGKVNFPAKPSDQESAQWRGSTFAFSLTTLTRGLRRRAIESEPSNVARSKLLALPGPIEDLRIRPTEKALELSWSPPTTSEDSSLSPLTGYRVYRSRTGEPGSFELLAETMLPNYSDANFELDRPLFYKVRAVFKESDQVAESEDSAVVPITPRDVY
ncbi:MAG: fibronectin type III domain-containing protein, partial [Acidobacteria bacterium]|nr:fibronectin type III domain-containing protein [Acidobacteriota bacterium]